MSFSAPGGTTVNYTFPVYTKGYGWLDASISYDTPDRNWTFTLEGRNITNVHWFSSAVQNGTAVAVYPDDPATVTVRARYRY